MAKGFNFAMFNIIRTPTYTIVYTFFCAEQLGFDLATSTQRVFKELIRTPMQSGHTLESL